MHDVCVLVRGVPGRDAFRDTGWLGGCCIESGGLRGKIAENYLVVDLRCVLGLSRYLILVFWK